MEKNVKKNQKLLKFFYFTELMTLILCG